MARLKIPKLTIALSGIMVIAYLVLSSMLLFADKNNISEFGFSINKMANIINYSFVHSSYAHLFANLAIIIASGIVVESALRKRDFLALFFGGAAFSAIVFCAISPQYSLVGASAGAVSLLGAAIVIDPKKTAAYAAIALVAGYLVISGIAFYVESAQKKIAEEVIVLEQAKKEAVHLGNNAEAENISAQITKTSERITFPSSLGPSNSQKRIPCHVPRINFESLKGTAIEQPTREDLTWASLLPSEWE